MTLADQLRRLIEDDRLDRSWDSARRLLIFLHRNAPAILAALEAAEREKQQKQST